MRSRYWMLAAVMLAVFVSAAAAQAPPSPYAPLLKLSILAPAPDGDWEGALRGAKIDTSTPAVVYVALYHADYWTRVAALHVLGARSGESAARSALLQVLEGCNHRMATWAGEILAQRCLERARVTTAMRAIVADGNRAADIELPELTKNTIGTQQQQKAMECAQERLVNALWATRVLVLMKDASGYMFLVAAARAANICVYAAPEVMLLVVRNYADAGLPVGTDLLAAICALVNNRDRVSQIRQLAQQTLDRLVASPKR